MNWSSLARKYNITNRKGEIAKNGGQIAQDWVISQGENIHRFKSQCQPIDSKRIYEAKVERYHCLHQKVLQNLKKS